MMKRGVLKYMQVIHRCPFENQGEIHKIIYTSNTMRMIIYECDECMAFWDNPYIQNKDNAIGYAFDGGDNNYFNNHGMKNIEEIIDEGSYY